MLAVQTFEKLFKFKTQEHCLFPKIPTCLLPIITFSTLCPGLHICVMMHCDVSWQRNKDSGLRIGRPVDLRVRKWGQGICLSPIDDLQFMCDYFHFSYILFLWYMYMYNTVQNGKDYDVNFDVFNSLTFIERYGWCSRWKAEVLYI